jgi:NAD+ kinase
MKTVGVVPHRDRPRAHELARTAAAWLGEHGVNVCIPSELAGPAGLEAHAVDAAKFAADLDLAMSFGGDGTMLHTVQLVYPSRVPIIGVNVGQLGYLSELEPNELAGALPRLVAGEFSVSERMALAVDVVSSGPASGTWYALNEAVLEKPRAGHLVYLDVSINGSAFTSYAADGGNDCLFVLGAWSDRVACDAVHGAHADLAAHAVRPVARAGRARDARPRRRRRPSRRTDDRRARSR